MVHALDNSQREFTKRRLAMRYSEPGPRALVAIVTSREPGR